MPEFLSVAGTQLALPDYARTDLAFTSTTFTKTNAAGVNYIYRIAGDYIEVILNLYFVFTSSAVVADRLPYAALSDEGGHLVNLSASDSTQPASLSFDYSLSVGQPFAYGSLIGAHIIGLPPVALLPGYSLTISAYAFSAGDVVRNISLTTIKVPTGPGETPRTVAAPTIMLV